MWQPGVVFLRADRFFGPQPSVTSTVKQGVLTNSPSRKRIRHNKLLLHKDVMSRKEIIRRGGVSRASQAPTSGARPKFLAQKCAGDSDRITKMSDPTNLQKEKSMPNLSIATLRSINHFDFRLLLSAGAAP
jgi:hypothetical protein